MNKSDNCPVSECVGGCAHPDACYVDVMKPGDMEELKREALRMADINCKSCKGKGVLICEFTKWRPCECVLARLSMSELK